MLLERWAGEIGFFLVHLHGRLFDPPPVLLVTYQASRIALAFRSARSFASWAAFDFASRAAWSFRARSARASRSAWSRCSRSNRRMASASASFSSRILRKMGGVGGRLLMLQRLLLERRSFHLASLTVGFCSDFDVGRLCGIEVDVSQGNRRSDSGYLTRDDRDQSDRKEE